jgi:hypothetical protein
MKLRKLLVLCVAFCLITFLAVFLNSQEKVLQSGNQSMMLDNLKSRVSGDLDDIISFVKDVEIENPFLNFTQNGEIVKLTTPSGDVLTDPEKIHEYWKGLRDDEKITDLKLETVSLNLTVHISPFIEIKPDKIDATAVQVVRFHIITDSNDTGEYEHTRRHVRECVW